MQDDERCDVTITPNKGENPADAIGKNSSWDAIDWKQAEAYVSRLQRRIAEAKLAGKRNLVKRLQHLLTRSFYGRAIAVRRVTERNRGKYTSGVDGTTWNSLILKYEGVISLNKDRYHSAPLRRIYIPKKSGKLRPLSIPTMYDRSMQALYALALDPLQEATADPNSYGFRIGRSCKDAAEQIFQCTSCHNQNPWILDADIKSCFDRISHEWLLNNIPMERKVLRQFLKAGFVYHERLFPTEDGTPQGGIISPILANMTLNGIEKLLREQFPGEKIHPIRYADDLIVTAPSKELAEEVQMTLVPFLSERGLEFSEEKTKIVHVSEGFDFLGWNFRKWNGKKMIIRPSKASLNAITDKIHRIILEEGLALTQNEIIWGLNSVLRGWGNYHNASCAKTTFSYVDHYVVQCLLRWANHRHPRKGRKWHYDRYWKRVGKRKWTFCTKEATLFKMVDIRIRRHIKVRANENPYLNPEYFVYRRRYSREYRGHRDKEIAS